MAPKKPKDEKCSGSYLWKFTTHPVLAKIMWELVFIIQTETMLNNAKLNVTFWNAEKMLATQD